MNLFARNSDYHDNHAGGASAVIDRMPEGADTDELLALRCPLGEPAAYDELPRRWAAPLRRYVLRMTQDSSVADNLLQEIWLAVLQGIGRLRDGRKLRSWLFGIADRKVMDRLLALCGPG